MRLRTLVVAGVVWCAASGAVAFGGAMTTGVRPQPNVLIFLLDDLGKDYVHAYPVGAAASVSTPAIDAFAASGVTFATFYAGPVCGCSRAALLSGQYVFRTGTYGNDAAFSPNEVTWVYELAEVGYSAAVFGDKHIASNWDVGANRPYLPWGALPESQWLEQWHRGFAEYGFRRAVFHDSTDPGGVDDWTEVEHELGGSLAINYYTGPSASASNYRSLHDEHIVNKAIAWLAEQRAEAPTQPWVAQLNFHSVHSPWAPPPGSSCTPNTEDCFIAMLAYVDTQIAELWAAIPLAVRERTLVWAIADNGGANGIGGKGTGAENGVSVVAIASGGVVRAALHGTTRTELHAIADVGTTALDLGRAGRTPSARRAVAGDPRFQGQPRVTDGVSLRGVLRGDGSPENEHEYVLSASTSQTGQHVFRDATFKLWPAAGTQAEKLTVIGDEVTDVQLVYPADYARLRAAYDALLATESQP